MIVHTYDIECCIDACNGVFVIPNHHQIRKQPCIREEQRLEGESHNGMIVHCHILLSVRISHCYTEHFVTRRNHSSGDGSGL